MTTRTYCYAADLTPLSEVIARGDAARLAKMAITCWEEADEEPLGAEDREALQDLFAQALAGQHLYADLDPEEAEALDDELGLLWSECLGSEPVTDNDLPCEAYAEVAEWLQTKGNLRAADVAAVWLFAQGRRWGQGLPDGKSPRYTSGFALRTELPAIQQGLKAAQQALRGPEGEGFRPVIDEALQAVASVIEASADLTLRLIE